MSIQIFVEGKLAAQGDFHRPLEGRSEGELLGRRLYASMVGELIPRVLLDRLGLSRMLLGAASGNGFLLLLPSEMRASAEAYLTEVQKDLARLTGDQLLFHWAVTENLGEWPVVRRRLFEEMQRNTGTGASMESFVPFSDAVSDATTGSEVDQHGEQEGSYWESLAQGAPEAKGIVLDPERAARFHFTQDNPVYSFGYDGEGVPWSAHLDLSQVRQRYGAYQGAALQVGVDAIEIRLRRANSVEEYLKLNHLYKGFFAGELQTLLLRLPDCTGKIAILDTGTEGFTVFGELDSLLKVAGEMHRLFETMAAVNLRELAGTEGKTISAGFAVGAPGAAVAAAEANRHLAQAAGRDGIHLFERILDWNLLEDAKEIRALCLKMIRSYGASPQFVAELSAFFREGNYQSLRRKTGRFERPWRLYRRLTMALETDHESKEFQQTRKRLLAEFIGKNAGQARLRPSGRVGLELTRATLNQ